MCGLDKKVYILFPKCAILEEEEARVGYVTLILFHPIQCIVFCAYYKARKL